MQKNITLLISVEPPGSPLYIRRIVETAINQAEYKGQLQFVFAVDESDKVCLHEVHKLYQEHQPSMFDPFPVATIKLINRNKTMYSEMLQKADSPLVMCCEPIVYFTEKAWDKQILDDFDLHKGATRLYYRMDNFNLQISRKESVIESEKTKEELKTA